MHLHVSDRQSSILLQSHYVCVVAIHVKWKGEKGRENVETRIGIQSTKGHKGGQQEGGREGTKN